MSEGLSFAAQQIVGKRETQEDSLRIVESVPLPDDPGALMLVLGDGMGGHAGGAIASELVCTAMVHAFLESDGTVNRRLDFALHKATEALAARVNSGPGLTGMGTTIIAAVLSRKRLFWLSVGDSIVWLLRAQKLTRLNQDHSMAPVLDKLAASGQISSEEARVNPTRHHLRSVVNGKAPYLIDMPQEPFALKAGDQLVLASDGLMTISEQALSEILTRTEKKPSYQALDTLFSAIESVNKPAQDNASAILVRIGGAGITGGSVEGIGPK